MRLHPLVALMAAGALAPATASAAGFPAPGMDTTKSGATAPGDPYRYVAYPGGSATTLAKIRRAGGVTLRHRALKRAWIVAPVALDVSTTGLSADGATLVLVKPRQGLTQGPTRLVVLDTLTLAPTRRLTLRGNFTLDGVSRDGRRLYLIQYRDAGNNPLDYAVRAYDVAHRRLLPKPIVDPRNPDEKMVGFPMTRATSADGRWAYTLYGGNDEPFVHALDTTRSRAFCVDLPGLLSDELGTMRLVPRHGRVDVVNQAGATVRHIDASTFRVTKPPPEAVPAPAKPNVKDETPSDGFPWGLAAAVAAVGAAALFVLRRRYAAGADSAASRSASSSTPTVP